jgi:hypothetical protein
VWSGDPARFAALHARGADAPAKTLDRRRVRLLLPRDCPTPLRDRAQPQRRDGHVRDAALGQLARYRIRGVRATRDHGRIVHPGQFVAPQHPKRVSRVREILTNPWYAGKVRSHGELRDGNHAAILPWDEFQRIAAKLSRPDPVSAVKRRGGRPSDVALLSGVMVCGHCGGGVWHRKIGKKRYHVCGRVRHATGACDATKFDAVRAEQAVAAHLDSIFIDFAAWLETLTQLRADQRDGLVRELATLHARRADLVDEDDLVGRDYMRQLKAGKEAAADVAASELERMEANRGVVEQEVADVEARLRSGTRNRARTGCSTGGSEFSAAIRSDVTGAESDRDANTALREHFAAIEVRCGNTPTTGRATFDVRFDFILKDDDAPTKPFWLHLGTDGNDQLRGAPRRVVTDRLTFVYVQPPALRPTLTSAHPAPHADALPRP